jgi:hypothetical protein
MKIPLLPEDFLTGYLMGASGSLQSKVHHRFYKEDYCGFVH